MFFKLKYYREMNRLNANLRRIHKSNAATIEKAKNEGASSSAIYNLQQELLFHEWDIEDQISLVMSRHLCREAHAHRIPISIIATAKVAAWLPP
jgi:hypothetical protein